MGCHNPKDQRQSFEPYLIANSIQKYQLRELKESDFENSSIFFYLFLFDSDEYYNLLRKISNISENVDKTAYKGQLQK